LAASTRGLEIKIKEDENNRCIEEKVERIIFEMERQKKRRCDTTTYLTSSGADTQAYPESSNSS
jgi:hypothetical protein